MHDLTIITTLAGGLAVALVLGWMTQRLGLSTLVGYMLAGIVVGPYTPGFVADAGLASQMAEIGVILLMFGVGMHFHPQELLRVWRIAVPGAVAQSAVAAVAGGAAARWFGWSHGAGIVFGMALAVASTVVLMRMLVEQDRLSSRDGHVAVGWLIVEDLFTVIALVVLPALAVGQTGAGASGGAIGSALAIALGKAALFAALIWVLGTRLLSPAMERIAKTRSTELFTLTVFVIALGVALLATEVFNVSVALGAFFGGLVVGQSRFGSQAAADMMPFRDVFSALFFVSVGMLFNPALILSEPGMILIALAIVLIVKPLVALAIVMIMRDTPRTAMTVAVGLAQIGEFSFILAALGKSLGILPPEGFDVLVVAAIVSIALNPLLFRAQEAIEARSTRTAAPDDDRPAPAAAGGAVADVIITGGHADLTTRVVERCAREGIAVCVVCSEPDALAQRLSPGVTVTAGDAGSQDVLLAAGLSEARMIVVTQPLLADKMRICIAARAVNPRIAVVATANSDGERIWLEEFGAAFVCDALDEMSDALLRSVRSGL
jgi:CPA2 family monovalent cation:H+ antiporter-2